MNGADVVAEVLKKEGVDLITCFPQSEIIDTVAAQGIRPVMARTERVALHMADGYSRVSDGRQLGVCTVQMGPGSENAFGAIAQAYGDSTPILYLPTGYPRAELSVAPNFEASANLGRVTKWAATVNLIERIPQMMQHAFTQLRNGRPSPVMLEMPVDILNEETNQTASGYIPPRRSSPHPDPTDLQEVLDALLAAQSPVIFAGQGVFYAQACAELRSFAELVQVPVVTTLNAKSAFPENHPLALGTGALGRPDTVRHFLDKADLVVGIGTSFTRSAYITPVPEGKTIAQITNTESDVSKDYCVSYGAIGDAKAALIQMIDSAKARLGEGGRAGNGVAAEVASVRAAYMKKWMPLLTSDEEPINPYRVIWELMHVLDRDRSVVTHDAGSPRDQMTAFFEATVPHGYIGWGKTTQLGTGMALAMGAKLARPDWTCVNVMGDAAFGMVGMDFETAVRNDIPILTVILNNSVMGGYAGYLPVATEKYEINRLSGDYAKVAEGLGGYAERVEKVADLKAALGRGVEQTRAGRPSLIEVRTSEEKRFAKDA